MDPNNTNTNGTPDSTTPPVSNTPAAEGNNPLTAGNLPGQVIRPSSSPASPAIDSPPSPVAAPVAVPATPVAPAAVAQPAPTVASVAPSVPISPAPAAGMPPTSASPMPPQPPVAPSSKRRLIKSLIIVVVALVVLGGGAAAAYVGIVVPNKPANVLKTAVINSVSQSQLSVSGTYGGQAYAGSTSIAYKGSFDTAEDLASKSVDLQFSTTISGITFPIEARLVDQNLYVKVGDLSTIANFLNSLDPTTGSVAQSLSSDLSNKWIEIDSTLLDEDSSVKCVLSTSWQLSTADLQMLQTQYSKHPFVTIQSSSKTTINGDPAEKFSLNIDNDASNTYSNSLSNLSVIKNLNKCSSSLTMNTSTSSTAGSHSTTPLTVVVDKKTKRVVQIATSLSSKSSAGSSSASLTANLRYGPVSVSAPANPEPALQLLTDLENTFQANPSLANLFSATGSGSTASPSSSFTTLTQ